MSKTHLYGVDHLPSCDVRKSKLSTLSLSNFACDRPRPTQGLPGPSSAEPPEESETSPERAPPGQGPKSAEKSAPRSLKESDIGRTPNGVVRQHASKKGS